MEKFTFAQADAYTTELDHKYRKRLYRYILNLMDEKNEEEANDIVQTTFLKLCTSIRSRRLPLDYPHPWLRQVAENLYKEAISGGKSFCVSLDKESIGDGQTAPKEIPDNYYRPDVRYELKERLETVTEQIHAIPRKSVRDVMELLSQGSDVQEIAQQLDKSAKTTQNNISEGREYLRQQSPYEGLSTDRSFTSEGEKQGSDVQEIAQQLNKSPKTTRKNISRGRALLRQHSSYEGLSTDRSSTPEGEKQ